MNIQGVNMLGISSRNTLQNKTDNKNVNFEGKFGDKISDFTAKIYGKYIANSNRIRNFAEKASKKADVENVTNHFQVAGSAVTSGSTPRRFTADKREVKLQHPVSKITMSFIEVLPLKRAVHCLQFL